MLSGSSSTFVRTESPFNQNWGGPTGGPVSCPPVGDEAVRIVYRVRAHSDRLAARVDALLLEQTVEVPRRALTDARVRETTVGRVVTTEPAGDDEFLVTLEQPVATTAIDPAQLLNVLFGNSSLQPDVELVDVTLPDTLARSLGGPRFGLLGLRRLTGVAGRALTCSTVKPMGLPADAIGELCRTLALGGLDVIKDDHGLADHSFCPFRDRVRACLGRPRGPPRRPEGVRSTSRT